MIECAYYLILVLTISPPSTSVLLLALLDRGRFRFQGDRDLLLGLLLGKSLDDHISQTNLQAMQEVAFTLRL